MSNFSLPKNVPPVFQQVTGEKVVAAIKQPFAIAVLASLGVHGLLWVGLPFLNSSSQTPPEQRTLNVVELSPLEQQARLPETAATQPLPTSGVKPQSKPSISAETTVPLIPVDPSMTDLDSAYQIPGLDENWQADPPVTRKPAPPKPAQKSAPPEEPASKTPEEPTDIKPDEKSEEKPDDPTETPESPDSRSPGASDLTDPNGKPLSKSREDQEKLAFQQAFTFNAEGTSDEDFQSGFASAGVKLADKYGEIPWEKPLKAQAPYPVAACQFQHDGKPVQGKMGLAVVMLPNGSLADTAIQVRSTGFKGLDEAARTFVQKQWSEILKQNKVEPTGKNKAFVVQIQMEPGEACKGTEKPAS